MDTRKLNQHFELLISEIDNIIDNLNQEGAQKFSVSDHIATKMILEKVEKLNHFRSRFVSLYDDFVMIETGILGSYTQKDLFKSSQDEDEKILSGRTSQDTVKPSVKESLQRQKKPRSRKTSEEKYRIPILIALESLGGSAFCQNVLNIVEDLMKSELNETDMEGLKSDPKTKRWRNTAMWARNRMKEEGLLKSDSPRGVWELDEAGWKFLENNK